MTTGINPKVVHWFETRGINAELLHRMPIGSGRHVQDGDRFHVEPDPDGEVIVFGYVEDGKTVNEKYRARGKRFYQRPNGTKTFWNADILDDPGLQDGTYALVITEGEIDALSGIAAGYPFIVSVPDGAPPARDRDGNLIAVPKDASDIDPQHDDKFSYVAHCWDKLKAIKRIVIAADNDEQGRRLAEELVRRLGRARCYWVSYPDGCKDLNDVLMQHGIPDTLRVILDQKPFPLSGLYTLSQFPAEPDFNPVTTGWARLDDFMLVYYPAFITITGFAGSGKTTWANQFVGQLARIHGWRCAIASFEMRIKPFVINTLRATILQTPKRDWTEQDCKQADAWIEKHFVFIAPDAAASDDEDITDVDWIIERAAAAVIRHGIRVLMIDPWNEIEHTRRREENHSDYVGRAIRALKQFGRRFDVLVIVVAHPTKEGAKKKPDDLSLYDVSDSAHFANKTDIGVIISRVPGAMNNVTIVNIRKVRYQPDTGRPGQLVISFDEENRIFSQ